MNLFDANDHAGWIVIPNWNRLQHYRDRRPAWIKLYPELLDDPSYLALPVGARLLLIELWMLYASSRGQVSGNTATLSRRLGHRVFTDQLQALNDAGFVTFSASKPLAQSREEKRREERRHRDVVPNWQPRPMQ